jgi:hypothetical protein
LNASIYTLKNTDADLDPFIERVGDAHYVLLGEASHGTSEFYFYQISIQFLGFKYHVRDKYDKYCGGFSPQLLILCRRNLFSSLHHSQKD